MMQARWPRILLLGPDRSAISGVSTHVNALLGSSLARTFHLEHFRVGREGRAEGPVARGLRFAGSPVMLLAGVMLGRIDIVHLNTSLNRRAYWRDLAYLLLARLAGARVVYQVHGGAMPCAFAGDNRLLEAILKRTLELPDLVVVLAQSEYAAYREFVPRQRVVVVPNAIDVAQFPTTRRFPRPDDGAPLRLVYIGRLSREKGLHEAIDAVLLARHQGIYSTFVIAGSGDDEPALREHVSRLGLADAVQFPGPQFGTDKTALLQRSDVLLMPTYAEGLPYALLEAMAAGVPAITTPVGAIPDVMTDGIHGVLVSPRDPAAIAAAIVRLAQNPEMLSRMSGASRRRIAERYSLERLALDFSRLYCEVATSERPARAPLLSRSRLPRLR